MTKVIEIIETEERRGTGADGDPIRMIKQYYTKSGELLWEEPDKVKEKIAMCVCENPAIVEVDSDGKKWYCRSCGCEFC